MDCTPDSANPEKDLPGNALLFEHVQQFVADRKIMLLPVYCSTGLEGKNVQRRIMKFSPNLDPNSFVVLVST
jgi:hypothetical protein